MNESLAGSPVLVVAAHPDDEALGCGGTMARLAKAGCEVHVLLLADGETSRQEGSSAAPSASRITLRAEAARKAAAILGCASLELLGLPDNRMDGLVLLDVVQRIERVVQARKPACVLTHQAGDVNVDHGVVHEAVITACRPQPGHTVKKLMFFEIASSTEWRPPASGLTFAPNVFVDISGTLSLKLKALEAYSAELRTYPHPRSLEAVTALARWRGASAGIDAAEAFMLGREIG